MKREEPVQKALVEGQKTGRKLRIQVIVTAEGDDAVQMLDEIQALNENKFDEE